MGPFTLWPTGEGIGFDYFYGFLAGETSQWEPRLFENLNPVEPPHDETYHLSEDMADKAIAWMRQHRAFAPDKPFFMYWAPGRRRTGRTTSSRSGRTSTRASSTTAGTRCASASSQRQKELGWIPADTKLTPRAESMAAWDSIPEPERPFQRRLMEVFAGFVEHVDVQVGKLVDELERLGRARQHDHPLHLRRQRLERRGPERHASASCWRRTRSRTRSSSSSRRWTGSAASTRWAAPRWTTCTTPAGPGPATRRSSTPSSIASHFGGTRNPMAISWPKRIKPDKTPRSQFHHVNDIVPTHLRDPRHHAAEGGRRLRAGPDRRRQHGLHLRATRRRRRARRTQYFDNNGSRGIYHDGWFACTFGPLTPWLTVSPRARRPGTPNKDVWELYDLGTDFSQADDLAAQEPERLAEMKALFLARGQGEQGRSRSAPASGCASTRRTASRRRTRAGSSTRRRPACRSSPRPGSAARATTSTIDVEVGESASGVLYALGGASRRARRSTWTRASSSTSTT